MIDQWSSHQFGNYNLFPMEFFEMMAKSFIEFTATYKLYRYSQPQFIIWINLQHQNIRCGAFFFFCLFCSRCLFSFFFEHFTFPPLCFFWCLFLVLFLQLSETVETLREAERLNGENFCCLCRTSVFWNIFCSLCLAFNLSDPDSSLG